MRAGDMSVRITLQRHDTVTDSWLDLEETPEIWAAALSLGDERYEFRVRYRADLIGLKDARPAMRILYGDRVLDLIDVAEGELRAELRLTALAHRVEIPDIGSTARHTTTWPS